MWQVELVWPEVIAGAEDARSLGEQPGLEWDTWPCCWAATPQSEAALKAEGCSALLSRYCDDMDEGAIEWTSPQAILEACDVVTRKVDAEPAFASALLAEWTDYDGRPGTAKEQLLEDLNVLRSMARWVSGHGKQRVTFWFSQ